MMIYPIYGKPDTLEPYVSLYEDFRKLLRRDDIYVCVGYSFRDKAINAAFSNSLKRMSSKRLVIVSTKKSKKMIRNNTADFPSEQLDYIEIPFGNDKLFEELENVLTQRAMGI
jgi:DNA-binding NtrC family response regulator